MNLGLGFLGYAPGVLVGILGFSYKGAMMGERGGRVSLGDGKRKKTWEICIRSWILEELKVSYVSYHIVMKYVCKYGVRKYYLSI